MALKKNPRLDLKRKYKRTIEVAIALSLSLLIAAFKYFPVVGSIGDYIPESQELVNVEDIPETTQNETPPPPPEPATPIEADLTDELLDDFEFKETTIDVNEQIAAPQPKFKEEEVTAEFVPFYAVEKEPEIIGGLDELYKIIKYPTIAQRANVQGQVVVRAFVDEKGEVQKTELLKGIGAGCDEEALKAVSQLKFYPAEQRGKPVKVQINIPIRFTLD
ncbi:MAG: TonB family protein [Melioribacteraceae bacterium]|nr:TonB family protein [Melioribacteraceae bacterium]